MHRAEIKIRYYSGNGFQELSDIKGISYNLDAGGKPRLEPVTKGFVGNWRHEIAYSYINLHPKVRDRLYVFYCCTT